MSPNQRPAIDAPGGAAASRRKASPACQWAGWEKQWRRPFSPPWDASRQIPSNPTKKQSCDPVPPTRPLPLTRRAAQPRPNAQRSRRVIGSRDARPGSRAQREQGPSMTSETITQVCQVTPTNAERPNRPDRSPAESPRPPHPPLRPHLPPSLSRAHSNESNFLPIAPIPTRPHFSALEFQRFCVSSPFPGPLRPPAASLDPSLAPWLRSSVSPFDFPKPQPNIYRTSEGRTRRLLVATVPELVAGRGRGDCPRPSERPITRYYQVFSEKIRMSTRPTHLASNAPATRRLSTVDDLIVDCLSPAAPNPQYRNSRLTLVRLWMLRIASANSPADDST